MKYLVAGVILGLVSCQSSNTNSNILSDDDEQAIQEIITKQLPQAYREQDTVLLNKLLHESYRLIDDNGDLYSKQNEIDYVSNYGVSYTAFEYNIQQIELYKNGTARVIGKCTLRGMNDDGSVYETKYTSSDMFIKVASQWQSIHGHVSGVKEEVYQAAPTE